MVAARLAERDSARTRARAFYAESLELWLRIGNALAVDECRRQLDRLAGDQAASA